MLSFPLVVQGPSGIASSTTSRSWLVRRARSERTRGGQNWSTTTLELASEQGQRDRDLEKGDRTGPQDAETKEGQDGHAGDPEARQHGAQLLVPGMQEVQAGLHADTSLMRQQMTVFRSVAHGGRAAAPLMSAGIHAPIKLSE
jgi:hypothetical protein